MPVYKTNTADMHTLHTLQFAETGMFLLNKFQVYTLLRVHINTIEKKENNVRKKKNRIFIFSCAYASM